MRDQRICTSRWYFYSGEGRKRCQLSITSTSEVNIGAKDIDLANATAILKTPSGSSEPCLLKKMADGSIGMVVVQFYKKRDQYVTNQYI